IDNTTFDGFVNADVMAAGTDNTRSVCLDFEVDHNIFRNITQTVSLVPRAMNVTGYNFKIHDNLFDSLAYNSTACRCSHNAWIAIYGNGDINNNRFLHSYANDVRLVPMKFSGLSGYDGPMNVYNNVAAWHSSYSFIETSPNNGYGRASGNNGYVSFTDTRIYFNTVYSTKRDSYNGDYSGMVADVYAQNGTNTPVYNRKVFVHNNVIINPEWDRPFSPSTRGNYIIYFGNGASAVDSGGNRMYQTLAQAGITDSAKWVPGTNSGLYKTADASNPSVSNDINGVARPSTGSKCIGAAEANGVVAAPAPANQAPVAKAGADQTITLPTASVTLDGSGSADADGKITTYSWSLISGPAATIANATSASTAVSGLIAGSYSFRLLVTDNAGATGADTVVITVNAAPAIQAPAPVAGTGTGLRADYYNTNDFSGNIILTRTDATVNFDWQYGSPASSINTDDFSARWSGQVQPAYTETYTFYTNSDDGVRVWVNGQQLINNWTLHGPVENSGSISLAGGQKYNIVVEYYEHGGGAVAQLSWSSASTPKAIIPQSRLYPVSLTGNGTGLKGEYYNSNDLSGAIVLTRTDATVSFDWAYGSPAGNINADNFSVSWSGQVQPLYSETYTFYTSSDDGVQLWVNGQQIINNWTDHGTTENSGTISLVAGQKYSIVMKYYEKGGGAVAKLLWSSASTPKAVVPQSQLYPATATTTTTMASTAVTVGVTAVADTKEALLNVKTGLAPNPVIAGQTSTLTFVAEKDGAVAIQLLDIGGRLMNKVRVNAQAGANRSTIATSGLRPGMYVVQVVEDGKATSYKLLVQ
ncbi:MAG: T9SS type A sorting domain-containing protein, partial [Bacteroidetes bacterium]|nr:T9SS type A sorting domain-containing protein [Bacteroidota bacterium]